MVAHRPRKNRKVHFRLTGSRRRRCVRQRLLRLLQLHDLFFNGVLCNELIHLHRVLLTDAVGAVGGLILGRHVPPRVVVDDDVGRGQVQAGAAGPQRDQEYAGFPALKRRTSSARTGLGVEPCRVKWLTPASSSRWASRSSMEVN